MIFASLIGSRRYSSVLEVRAALWFAVAVLALPATTAFAETAPELVVDTSHNGTVDQLEFIEERGLLFSGGTDGAIRVWDTETRELTRSVQVSQLPIRKLTVHPERPEIAVLVRTTQGYRLSVWDYDAREELFFEELPSEPLHLDYSPQGTWLIYTRTASDSIVTLDAETGDQEELVGTRTGIVGYFTIGSSEANIMSYAPANGRIQYTRLEDGEVLQSNGTIAGMENLQVLQNRRYAAARDDDDLVVVDIVDGTEIARTTRERIRDIVLDNESGRIGVLYGTSGNRGIEIYEFRNDRLVSREEYSGEDTRDVSSIEFIGGSVYTGGPEGRLTILTDDEPDLFAENLLNPIRSVAFGERSLLVTANSYTSTIQSDFFGSESMDSESSNRATSSHPLSPPDRTRTTIEITDPEGRAVDFTERFSRRSASLSTRRALRRVSPELELSRSDSFGRERLPEGVDALDTQDITIGFLDNRPWSDPPEDAANLLSTLDNRILLWDTPDLPLSWSTVEGPGDPIPGSPEKPVKTIVEHDAGVSILYDDGMVEQRHPITFELLKEYEVGNVETAAFVRDDTLVAGRNASGRSGSALIRINPDTGETVNLDTGAFYVFRMAVDRRRGAMYVLGLTRSDDGIVTTLERFTGEGLRESEVLTEVPAEDLEADVTVDDRTGTVYVGAGLSGVIVWDGDQRTLPQTDHLARRLTVSRGKIVSVNGNGTVSIWSQATEQHLGDVYLFKDGRWLALGAAGGFFTAEDLEVGDLLRAPDTDEQISSFRAELPVTFAATTVERGVHVEEVFRSLGPQ